MTNADSKSPRTGAAQLEAMIERMKLVRKNAPKTPLGKALFMRSPTGHA